MSDCIHKRWRSYIDPIPRIFGISSILVVVVLLKKAQNQWRVRLSETLLPDWFIYDLTTAILLLLLIPRGGYLVPKVATCSYDYFVPVFPVHFVRVNKRSLELAGMISVGKFPAEACVISVV